jgi:CO/xanthine dehydrogenase FAD-binding subunit
MQTFVYAKPTTIAEAVSLLDAHGSEARILAGGTDLIIKLRAGTLRPAIVVDLKRIDELRPCIREADGKVSISAAAVMTDIAKDPGINRYFPALVEAASVIGSIQIRNRATLAGNICNASPAADTAPPLLVHGADVVAVGSSGIRRIPINEFFVRSGETTLRRGELVMAVELPVPVRRTGAAHMRRARRRGHDLASVTLCCAVDDAGVTHVAYGSVGPRPVLVVDETGVLADPGASDHEKAAIFERMFAGASPSPRSIRASPAYRLAMLRVLGMRALQAAIERLAQG